MSPTRSAGPFDHLIGAILALCYVGALVATAPDLAMSRDESFYAYAAERYGAWFELLAKDPSAALERRALDHGWEYNHEHPPLMKTLFAWSWLAQKHWKPFPSDGTAIRFPAMALSGLFLWLLYVFGLRARGRTVGLFAAFAFALMPRVFYHAHLDCFDMPIAFMLTLVTYAYWRSLSSGRWVVITGLVYGLALSTKHNAWILPLVLLVHWVWMRVAARGEALPRPARLPWWLLSMAALGVPLFVASWPWLWHDTWARWKWYASFHLHHVHYSMEYLGTTYWKPPMPISYPWVMTLFTVPLVTLVLALLGVVLLAPEWLPAPILRGLRLAPRFDSRQTAVLWLGTLLTPLVVISLPSTPIFGGTKHWFPAYPFVALFAGVGFERVLDACKRWNPLGPAWADGAVAVGAFVAVLAAPLVETAHAHPFGLSYYTPIAGGIPGAASLGMNRQFWGFTQGSLAPWFRDHLPNGGTVWICDATSWSWEMMQRDGLVPNNIRASSNLASADYAIVHHEQHFAEVDNQIWVAFGTVAPVHVLTYDGVPIVSVYENPRHHAAREAAAPRP
ncbi:MAG: glycosyltransferase family 39 protein [Polyangiales bacterium]|nr:glycosyltransferase family 39 protein [Myxococcales bacterium]